MSLLSPLLADLSAFPPAALGQAFTDQVRAHLSLYGVVATVVALVLVWAVFFRKHARELSRYRSPHGSRDASFNPAVRDGRGAGPGLRKRRKWRRRRREHRPRNPTLAETGGLPPVRDSRPS